MKIICHYCQKEIEKTAGHVNRAKKMGLNLFCNRECAGFSRRSKLSDIEKKALKAEYDKNYRAENHDSIKKRKADYFKKTYDPAKASVERKKRMPKHIEYCRTEKYKKYKKDYDKKYRAKKNYGDFWECKLLVQEISNEYENRKIKEQNQLINKSQKRKRLWQQKIKIKNYLQRI
ncbi:hypothetical protein J2X97_000368 [Epilithonimonas hungarica]|uniref:hypothetical protein n=1 Tax=Epilithonimonas hungarica TaxID=454006 RepID=UPI002782A757|nr:hypothetical protein [Epilithonimonas hungarica]MDP9954731.1 hypothetical protein [Epilithonimonas hungarica]